MNPCRDQWSVEVSDHYLPCVSITANDFNRRKKTAVSDSETSFNSFKIYPGDAHPTGAHTRRQSFDRISNNLLRMLFDFDLGAIRLLCTWFDNVLILPTKL